ncbi:MAG TPA: methyltransferase [Pirellulales bacterium]|nr:methyltransferase [Pirellulales bacterium]
MLQEGSLDKSTEEATPESRLIQLVLGSWPAQAVYSAAKLELADHLHAGPKTADELAAKVGAHAPSLYRLLRALASLGVFSEDQEGRFTMTPMAELLRKNSDRSMWAATVMMGEEHYEAWGKLLQGVQQGETSFKLLYGVGVFDYFETHQEAARIFHRAMTEMTSQTHVAAVEAYDFSRFGKLIDVGGGRGTLIAAILRANPKLRGAVYDLPSVMDQTRGYLAEQGVADRCEAVGGDFFASIPEGADAYILSTVIHDWHDAESLKILRNIHRAMKPAGKLLLVERVLKGRNEPDFGKLMDLNMLVMAGGLERTAEEFQALLADAGFEMTRIIPTKSPSQVIEAVRRS